jgi:hypothetical protein
MPQTLIKKTVKAKTESALSPTKAGWRVTEYMVDTGLSRATIHELIAAHRLESVKLGSARIITTPPAEFLAGLASTKTA